MAEAGGMESRVESLRSWHDDWRGLRVAVLGLGVTGFSVADTLVELGAEVLVFSPSHDARRAELLQVIGARLIDRVFDDASADELFDFEPELVVASPGFSPQHPLIRHVEEAGIPLWGDIELAWRLRDKVGKPADWLLVTGAGGAAETTLLAEAMLLEGGLRTLACGNLGIPVLDAIRDPVGWDVLTIELSSAQLHYTRSLSAWSSLCIEAGSGPVDWHGSRGEYLAATARVYENSRVACIYNRSDADTLAMVEGANVVEGCRAIGFDLGTPGPSDLGLVDGILVDRAFHDDRLASAIELTTVEKLTESGLGDRGSVVNVLAASALVRSYGVPVVAVHGALSSIRGGRPTFEG
ncbi:hypothetical protein FB562_1233 [Homoserinimonas aerilata]|uniref:UDP-N-acetylmuramoylalanine--D-glutamate ligase n=1 Tax=Homoserinimonas aerilata TaxID=1162970 RepID=A0A542YJD9_9MICO|nr:hypothetical protein [Homoserinimonas aerilata]TQL48151.1 hypothetical protein FB562_1233 [Homoserinimonas aerilata]